MTVAPVTPSSNRNGYAARLQFEQAADKEARDVWAGLQERAITLKEVPEILADAVAEGSYSQAQADEILRRVNVVATAYAADPSADPWAALKRQPGPRKRRTAAAAATTISSPSVAAVIPGEGAVPEIVPARSNTNAPSSPQSDTSKQVNSCKGAYTADIGSDSNSRNEIAGNERAIRPLVGQTAKHSTSSTPHQEVKEEEDEEVDGDEQDWAKGPSGQLEWRPLSLRRQMARQEREARAVPSPTEVQAFTTALRSASPTKTSPKPPDAAGSSDSASASNSSADASPSAAMATTNAATMPTQEELQVAARVAAASAAENAAVRAAAAAADYDDEHEAKATSEEARTSRLPSPPPPDAPPAAVTTEETVAAADDDQSHHELPLPLEQREELVANQALHDDDGDGDGAVWEDAVPLAENKEEHGEASNDKQDSKKYDNATEELQQAKSVANYGSDEFDEDDDTDGEDEEDLAPPPPRAAPVPPVVPVLPVDTTTNTTTATTDTPTAADTAITTAAVEPHEESSSSPQPRDTPSPPALYDRASKELSKNTSEEASTPADNSSNSNEGSDSSGSGSSSNGGNRGEGEDRGRGRQSNNGGGRGDEGGGGGDERSSDEGTSEGGGNESGSGGNGRGGDKGEDDGPPDEPTRAGAPAEAETAEAETGDDDDNDGDKKGDMTKVKDEKENKGESAPINENTAATKLQCLQRGRDVRKASDQQLSRRQSTSASGTAPFPVPDDTADLVSNDAPSSVAGDGVGAAAANDSNDSVGGGPEAAVGDLEASPALNLAADLANAAKASAALAERGEEEDPLSPEQKLAQEAEAHVEKLLGRLDTLEGRKGDSSDLRVRAAQESQLAKQQFADASAQISRASADPDGDARATLAEAGRLLLDQALASDQLSAQHLSEADAFDKGFNREVVVLRSDCILHQANIDRRLSDLRSRVTATKHIRSKLRRRAHEVDVLKELKALTAASADAIKKAASPSKMRQATSNRATNAQAVGGEGGANENGNGGEGEGTQGSHNDDDDEDNDDEEEEEEGDEEEVEGFVGRLRSNRLECERIQADLDEKIAQLALDNNAEKLATAESDLVALGQQVKRVRRLVAFKASHGLLDSD